MSSEVSIRNADGTFLPGQSGNPAGRPAGKKNVITELKQNLEIAIRQGLTEEDVQAVVKSMLAEALNGNVGAGKLLLDKVLSNAKDQDDAQDHSGGLRIVIENATVEALVGAPQTIIDVTPEDVPNE